MPASIIWPFLIYSQISGEPDLTYEAVRKTAAQRRREMERSLINYMMCMHAHTTLFPQFESKVRNEAKQYVSWPATIYFFETSSIVELWDFLLVA